MDLGPHQESAHYDVHHESTSLGPLGSRLSSHLPLPVTSLLTPDSGLTFRLPGGPSKSSPTTQISLVGLLSSVPGTVTRLPGRTINRPVVVPSRSDPRTGGDSYPKGIRTDPSQGCHKRLL